MLDTNMQEILTIQKIQQTFLTKKLAGKISQPPQILAVSKLQPLEKIIQLLTEQNQILFGENYIQEAIDKIKSFQNLQAANKITSKVNLDANADAKTEIQWHLIGRLQKNKIKFILGIFDLIHSIDSIELASAFERRLAESSFSYPVQKILLQVNLSQEQTKGGFTEAELEAAIMTISNMPHLQICGFMTMPPLFDDPEQARPYFRQLRELRDHYQTQYPTCKELSMGTSSDYMVAAEEGSTIVRLGTILFGEREKH